MLFLFNVQLRNKYDDDWWWSYARRRCLTTRQQQHNSSTFTLLNVYYDMPGYLMNESYLNTRTKESARITKDECSRWRFWNESSSFSRLERRPSPWITGKARRPRHHLARSFRSSWSSSTKIWAHLRIIAMITVVCDRILPNILNNFLSRVIYLFVHHTVLWHRWFGGRASGL